MNVNELRVWNYLRFGEHIVRIQDLQGRHNYIQTIQGLDGYANQYTGIELTPEILEKCGFEVDKDNIYYLEIWTKGHPSARFIIEWKEGVGFMFRSRYQEYNECLKFRILKYLHQLQNIYHSLTGEELEIRL